MYAFIKAKVKRQLYKMHLLIYEENNNNNNKLQDCKIEMSYFMLHYVLLYRKKREEKINYCLMKLNHSLYSENII